jgi:hypothetical protein
MVILTATSTDDVSVRAVGRDHPGPLRAIFHELQGALALIAVCLLLVLIGLHLS